MSVRNNSRTLLMTFGAVLALSGCGGNGAVEGLGRRVAQRHDRR